jgi:hypothetical protein
MQNIADLFDSLQEHAMNVAGLPEVTTAYDQVGAYDQDAINGFSDHILNSVAERSFSFLDRVQMCVKPMA